MKPSPQEMTQWLVAWGQGNHQALDTLMPYVYEELRQVARRYLRRERPDHTLQPTALVHEAYLRLIDQKDVHWQSRVHFFSLAAEAMRRILVEHARRHHAAKRGGGDRPWTLNEAIGWPEARAVDLVRLDEALTALAAVDPQKSRIVELRFFGGLTVEETASVLGTSEATVHRAWRLARAWLEREIAKGRS